MLDSVDYDDSGQIRFAGTAPPGTNLRIYIDNQPSGDVVADAAGRWSLAPQVAVSMADHKLRIDQIAPSGQVATRIELPFQRTTVNASELAAGHMIVQPRENLWRIARRTYGKGMQYTVIYDANRNQIRDPNLIYPGQIFSIPAAPQAGGKALAPASAR
jgi:hypothetical protein